MHKSNVLCAYLCNQHGSQLSMSPDDAQARSVLPFTEIAAQDCGPDYSAAIATGAALR
jgi:hypothetical protein